MPHQSSSADAHQGWPTTRRYPRTMGDAFRGAAYGCAVEHYKPAMRSASTVAGWLAAGLSLFSIGVAIAGL